MKPLLCFFIFIVLFVLFAERPAHAVPYRYVIDPDHTSIYFMVDHLGFAKTVGRFNKFKGSFLFDEDALLLSDVKIVIYPESIDTANAKRDWQLKGPRYFNIGEYPQIVFNSVKPVHHAAARGRITGNLKILNKTRPVHFDFSLNKSAPSPLPGDRSYRTGVSLRGTIDRVLFGMAADLMFVGRYIDLIIEVEAIRQDDAYKFYD